MLGSHPYVLQKAAFKSGALTTAIEQLGPAQVCACEEEALQVQVSVSKSNSLTPQVDLSIDETPILRGDAFHRIDSCRGQDLPRDTAS